MSTISTSSLVLGGLGAFYLVTSLPFTLGFQTSFPSTANATKDEDEGKKELFSPVGAGHFGLNSMGYASAQLIAATLGSPLLVTRFLQLELVRLPLVVWVNSRQPALNLNTKTALGIYSAFAAVTAFGIMRSE